MLRELRRLLVAWVRIALAVQIVLLGPFAVVGGAEAGVVYVPGAVLLATPLALLHRWACRKDPPFLKLGYFAVAAYGPVLMCVPVVLSDWGWDDAAIFSMIYEVAALTVTGVYILLWRLGDLWLGDLERPRIGRRWACAAILVLALGIYLPFVRRSVDADDCMDRGGRVLATGVCDRT